MKKSKTLKTLLTSTVVLSTTGLLTTMASCSCGSNTKDESIIPEDAYLIEDGVIKGFKTDYDMSSIAKCTIAKMPSSAKSVGQDAFKNIFSKSSNSANLSNVNKIIFTKNIQSVADRAFIGCDAIQTIDISCFTTKDELNTFMSDDNCGNNVYASMSTEGLGTIVFADSIDDTCRNDIKLYFILAGLTKQWFKPDQVPTDPDIKITGGTEKIVSKEYESCESTSDKWNIIYEGVSIAKRCNWSVVPQSGTSQEIANKIKIDDTQSDGKIRLKWGNDIPAGDYKFTLKAVYVNPSTEKETSVFSQTDIIDLNVIQRNLIINGTSSIVTKEATPGTKQYKANLDGSDVTSSCTWTLSNTYENKFSISKTGLLSWVGLESEQEYAFDIIAEYTIPSTTIVKKTTHHVKVSVSETTFEIKGLDKISGFEYTPGSSQFTAEYEGQEVSGVEWYVLPTHEDKIKIDNNGLLSWSDLSHAQYSLEIVATYEISGIKKTAYKNIKLVISGLSIDIEGQTTLTSKEYTAGTSKYIAKYNGQTLSQNVKWEITNTTSEHISIGQDTGIVSWNDQLAEGTYKFVIKCTYNITPTDPKTKSIDVTLNVDKSTFIIEGYDKLTSNEFTEGSSRYLAKYDGSYVNPTWSLVGTLYSEYLSIDPSTGLLSWNNTIPEGTYTFHIMAQYTISSVTKEASIEVTLKVVAHELTIEGPDTITASDSTSGSQTYKAKYASKAAACKWSVKSNPTQGDHVTIDEDSGELIWDGQLTPGEYTLTITAKYTIGGGSKATNKTVKFVVAEHAVPITYNVASDITLSSKPSTIGWRKSLELTYTVAEGRMILPSECKVVIDGVTYKHGQQDVELTEGKIYIPASRFSRTTTSIEIHLDTMDEQTITEPTQNVYDAEEQIDKKLAFTTGTFTLGSMQSEGDIGSIKVSFDDSEIESHCMTEIIWLNVIDFQIKLTFDLELQGKTSKFHVVVNDKKRELTFKLNHGGDGYQVNLDYQVNKLTEAHGDFIVENNTLKGVKAEIKENQYYNIYINIDTDSQIKKIDPKFFTNLTFADRVIYLEITVDSAINEEFIFSSSSDDTISLKSLVNLRYLTIEGLGNWSAKSSNIKFANGALPRPKKVENEDKWYNDQLKYAWFRAVDLITIADESTGTEGALQNFTALEQVAIENYTTVFGCTFARCLSLEILDFRDWTSVPTNNNIRPSAFERLSSWADNPAVYVSSSVGTLEQWQSILYDTGTLDRGSWTIEQK